jgi:GAF domain-containing protein
MTATLVEEVAELRRANAELRRQRDEALAERDEGEAQKSAMAEVLEVINSSAGNLAPVFDAMLEKAMRLCGAAFGELRTYDGERFRLAATRGVPSTYVEYYSSHVSGVYGPGTAPARILAGERIVHVPDLTATEPYQRGDPDRRALVDLGGARAIVLVPLPKDDAVCGYIMIFRQEPGPFSDKQIALLQNFAAQAVVAMDNARLLGELRERTDDLQESLKYQTATSDVLNVISRSTFDPQPVLDTLAETALHLCEAQQAYILRREGEVYRIAAAVGSSPEDVAAIRDYQEFLETNPLPAGRGSLTGRVAVQRASVHIADVTADPEYSLPATRLAGIRTQLGVPLLRKGEPIGVIILSRRQVQPFRERQIELIRTFADQAVIAIENARLITETREALEQQTATAEVLQVINASPGDLAPVFDAMLEKAMRLCEADFGGCGTWQGDRFAWVADRGLPEGFATYIATNELTVGPRSGFARVARGDGYVQFADIAASKFYAMGEP